MKRLIALCLLSACAAQTPEGAIQYASSSDDHTLCSGSGNQYEAQVFPQELRARHPEWTTLDWAGIDNDVVLIGMSESAARCVWPWVRPVAMSAGITTYAETRTGFADSYLDVRGFTTVDGRVASVVSL